MENILSKAANIEIYFGGTFDPIHNGHIRLCNYLYQKFHRTINLVINNGNPSYKSPATASIEQRLSMLQSVVDKYPQQMQVDNIELLQESYSPTVNTIRLIINRSSAQIFWVIGSDSFNNIESWDESTELVKISSLIVVPRDSYPINLELAQNLYGANVFYDTIETVSASSLVILSQYIPDNISSSSIRQLSLDNMDISNFINNTTSEYLTSHNNIYKGI